jgi:ADP-ribosylglycohydrolase
MRCLFGSFIEDALRGYLEFAKEKDFSRMMKDGMIYSCCSYENAKRGIFGRKIGQVTDDSELTFHLLNSMANFDTNLHFQRNLINSLSISPFNSSVGPIPDPLT